MNRAGKLAVRTRPGSTGGILVDGCGCALGAISMGTALAISLAWYTWHWRSYGLTVGGASWRVLMIAFAAAIAGKAAGLLLFRMRASALRQSMPTLGAVAKAKH